MKPSSRQLFLGAAVALSFAFTFSAFAEEPAKVEEKGGAQPAPAANVEATPPAQPAQPAEAGAAEAALRRLDTPAVESSDSKKADSQGQSTDTGAKTRVRVQTRGGNGNDRVSIGHDAYLAAGERAEAVVAIIGSATSEGEVSDAVVAVLGNSRATGPVGDSVVAVLGSVYVNSEVRGDVVAVMGNIELGPEAVVHGDVVAVGGVLTRDPKAVVHGDVQNISIGHVFSAQGLDWLQEWFRQCLMYARPLAFGPHLGWAWGIALGLLGFYVVLALIFRPGVEKGIQTFETRPGSAIIAALLTALLTPIVIVLLCVTVIGVVLVPFLGTALLVVSLFGRVVLLAWLGRRFTRFFGDGPFNHPAVAVLVGGVIVLILYVVPIIGFLTYKLIGVLGMGTAVYTLILATRRENGPVATAPAMPLISPGATPMGVVAGGPMPATESPVPPFVNAPLAVPVNTLPRAGFWLRIAALLLDLVLVGLIVLFVSDFLPRRMHFHGGPGLLPLIALYGALMWKLKGTTIGGIVCGLKVVRLDGREIDWATAIVRALGCFLSLAVAGLGFIWIVIDNDRQSWHDKIAGTAVVRMPKGTSLI